MPKYTVTNFKDPVLRKVRDLAYRLLRENIDQEFESLKKIPADHPDRVVKKTGVFELSEVSARETQLRFISDFHKSELGYEPLHNVIFETLDNKKDVEDPLWKGLYDRLAENKITLDSLKHCIKMEQEQNKPSRFRKH